MKRFFPITLLLLSFTAIRGENLSVPSAEHPTIQSAIEAAKDGDNITAAPGRYRENISFLGKAIKVTSLDPNNPSIVQTTIIDGNNPADSNFASTVTFNSGEGNRSILTGFTITGGSGTWVLTSWEYKGLLWSRCGGGIVCYNKSQPTIIKNIIRDNFAGQGGGLYAYGDPVNPNDPSNPPVHIRPVIKGNIFINNSALFNHGFLPPDTIFPHFDRGDGGAIACFQGCDADINNNTISNNYAYNYGGGIRLRQWSQALIRNNEIIDNNGTLGGAIHVSYICDPVITGNYISSNIARGLGAGGISLYYNSSGIIKYNTIINNKAVNSKGGGIGVFWDSSGVIENNIIAKNSAIAGGGIYSATGNIKLKNNTIVSNKSATGSGIYIDIDSDITATGNIAALNNGSTQIYKKTQATLNASYNNVWSKTGENFSGDINDFSALNGNISEDPKLSSIDSNDFSLTVYSPCINAGDPNFNAEPGQKDINGDNRLIGQYIDIGADEARPVWNITKGTEYLSIQQAINDSNDADIVIAGRGRYYECISFGTHRLILSSADPNRWDVVEKTIIDANGIGTAVVITGGQDANTIFRGFTVTGGNAQNGHAGGILCYASPKIERNIIRNNYAYYKGGGLYLWSSDAKPIVSDNRIIENSATFGGGVLCDTLSRGTIINNLISKNQAAGSGAGICIGLNCSTTRIINNTISDNKTNDGAGLYSEKNTNDLWICSNLFSGNRATNKGGAMRIDYGSPQIISNTLAGNRSTAGAGIYLSAGASPYIANNIIAFNSFGEGIGSNMMLSTPAFISNDSFGNEGGNYGSNLTDPTGSNGNISIDPNFVDNGHWSDANTPGDVNDDFFVAGNYHILPISGCVNAADNNSIPAFLTEDFDGEERIFAGLADIGADEVVTNPLDLNVDGIVDYYELSILAGEWLQSGSGLSADFYGDNVIDFRDLAILTEQWFWTGNWYQSN